VPLIFAGPGIARGANCGEAVELLDIYPTLVEMCGLPQPEIPAALHERTTQLEGHSLVPQLKDPTKSREHPAITTHNVDNHGIRTDRWRYIRYADGSEELYDMQADPNEWHNLADQPQHRTVVRELSQWLPKVNIPPVPGSAHRLLVKQGDHWVWEGEVIDPAEKVE
jgi:arylsulfatase A-like enzyme